VVSRSLNVLYIIAHLRYGASLTSHSPYTFRSADLFKWLYHERVLHLVRRAQKGRKLEEQAFRQAGRVCAKGVAWTDGGVNEAIGNYFEQVLLTGSR
jgi:hypothetical protein